MLKTLGSIEGVRNATIEEINAVVRNKALSERIHAFFRTQAEMADETANE